MCEVLAKQGYNLIIVARRVNRLEQIKVMIESKYGCEVVMGIDY